MADRVPWNPKLAYRTGINDTFTVVDNDIVTRLQEKLDGAIPMVIEKQDVRDVIAEIERLRAEVVRLGSFLHPIGAVIHGQGVSGD